MNLKIFITQSEQEPILAAEIPEQDVPEGIPLPTVGEMQELIKVLIPASVEGDVTFTLDDVAEVRRKAADKDRRLGIKRKLPPQKMIVLPDTEAGKEAYEFGKGIEDFSFDVAPENDEQRFWMLYIQQYLQQINIMLMFKIFNVIPDPTQGHGVLSDLPAHEKEWLRLSTNINKALWDLIVKGEEMIQEFATAKGKQYPFNSHTELFIEILREMFYSQLWDRGPFDPVPSWEGKEYDTAKYSRKTSLGVPKKYNRGGLKKFDRDEHRRWLKFLRGGYFSEPAVEQEYFDMLGNNGWNGLSLLALWHKRDTKPLKKLWKDYVAARREGTPLAIETFYWEDGKLYMVTKKKQKSQVKWHMDCD
jgi:hypothetical protein